MTWQSAPLLVDPTVSTQWLADHLGSERLIVLDVSVVVLPAREGNGDRLLSGYDQYLFDGHIPGSVFADLVEGAGDPLDGVGVTADHTTVVYDSADGRFAEQARRLLTDGGYGRVAILDGGLHRWRSEGRPVEDGVSDGTFATRTGSARVEQGDVSDR